MVTEAAKPPVRRLWLVFFADSDHPLTWPLRRGWRHVSAASWYADQQRWVHVNPTAKGLHVEVYGETEFDGRLGQLATDATLVLRIPSSPAHNVTPLLSAWCVGIIKALLGIRSCALSPWRLSRHLLARGAERVEIPGPDVQGTEAATGRPEDEGPAGSRAGALGS
jgi:hypothetical protein